MLTLHLSRQITNLLPALRYLAAIWSKNIQDTITISTEEPSADSLTVGLSSTDTLKVAPAFAAMDFEQVSFDKDCILTTPDGTKDYLFTAFYMLNCLQETNAELDSLGRFQYSSSYQYKFGNVQKNIVQHCFDELSRLTGLTPGKQKTKFFLTHDIDMVHGAILEDGFHVVKKGRIDLFFFMLFRVAMARPDWLNIDQIMKLESEYDCRSVFFWIVNQGQINSRERNADYSFKSRVIQQHFNSVSENGFENGLHKSISADTFQQEIVKYGTQPLSNRYHYLKFNLPSAFIAIDEAGLKLDASVGFAEEPGFRNSYGLPFNPYDFRNSKPFSFVEAPLHIMDRTFFQYKKASLANAEYEIIHFFEQNKENCVLSVLWHNNFFTNYKFKGYLNLYKNILAYIRDNKHSTITQADIITQYSTA